MTFFNNMIADMISNKKINQTVTKLFIRRRGRKLNISTVFKTQSYFAVPEDVRLNRTHIFLFWKIQTNKNFNKSHLIIHQTLTVKTLWIFTKSVLQNHIFFYWMILHLHQIILHVLEKIFCEEYKTNHEN